MSKLWGYTVGKKYLGEATESDLIGLQKFLSKNFPKPFAAAEDIPSKPLAKLFVNTKEYKKLEDIGFDDLGSESPKFQKEAKKIVSQTKGRALVASVEIQHKGGKPTEDVLIDYIFVGNSGSAKIWLRKFSELLSLKSGLDLEVRKFKVDSVESLSSQGENPVSEIKGVTVDIIASLVCRGCPVDKRTD